MSSALDLFIDRHGGIEYKKLRGSMLKWIKEQDEVVDGKLADSYSGYMMGNIRYWQQFTNILQEREDKTLKDVMEEYFKMSKEGKVGESFYKQITEKTTTKNEQNSETGTQDRGNEETNGQNDTLDGYKETVGTDRKDKNNDGKKKRNNDKEGKEEVNGMDLNDWAKKEGTLNKRLNKTISTHKKLKETTQTQTKQPQNIEFDNYKSDIPGYIESRVELKCPKIIGDIDWFSKIDFDRKTSNEAVEFIKLMNRFYKFYGDDMDGNKEKIREVNEYAKKQKLKEKQNFLKQQSTYVHQYYDPKGVDYENLDIGWKRVETENEKNMWDYFRYIVSSIPYKPMFGKRERFFLHDHNSDTELGIMALSSPIMLLGKRDNYFGYNQKTSKEFEDEFGFNPVEYNPNGICIVPLQPFGMFAGGKLMTQMISSDYIIDLWEDEYKYKPWGLHTTSVYGKSIQYDRLYEWDFAGKTKGHGAGHYAGIEISKACRFIESQMDFNRPEAATSLDVRLLSELNRTLNIPVNLAYHGVGRGIYCCDVYKNFNLWDWVEGNLEINREEYKYPNDKSVKHRHIAPINEKYEFWRDRWFKRRWDKHKDEVDEWSIEDYMYGQDKQKQITGF